MWRRDMPRRFSLIALTLMALALTACDVGTTPNQQPGVAVPETEQVQPATDPADVIATALPGTVSPATDEPAPTAEATVELTNEPSAEVPVTGDLAVTSEDIDITSDGQPYASYIAYPTDGGGSYPGIVLIHSFNGLEEGYRTMTDRFAAQGFVVLALGWQTYGQRPADDVV